MNGECARTDCRRAKGWDDDEVKRRRMEWLASAQGEEGFVFCIGDR